MPLELRTFVGRLREAAENGQPIEPILAELRAWSLQNMTDEEAKVDALIAKLRDQLTLQHQ